MDQLMWAFEDAARENGLFLNTETGELIPEDELPQEEAIVSGGEEIEQDPRLIPVPEAEPRSGFEDMEDFVRTVTDGPCRRELEQALAGSKPFRRFKDALCSYPSERERWFQFKEKRLRDRVLEWLLESAIEPIEDTGSGQATHNPNSMEDEKWK